MNIEELITNFGLFEDWEEKYRYLIELGATLPAVPDTHKTEATKVRGCMSQVWMVPGWDVDGKLTILADSDAQIVKGLIAVLCVIYQKKTREEIKGVDADKIFKNLGLDQHLSPNRRNGFYAMLERIRAFTAGDK